MCNAHNHPPDCNCGWGGVWYGNSSAGGLDSWLLNRERPRYKAFLGIQRGTQSPLSASYVSPNSKCPVCGEPVYYYESHEGGRVFFDELGPPWAKHPCTSNDSQYSFVPNKGSSIKWFYDGWKYLKNVTISFEEKVGESDIYCISGASDDNKKYKFYFLSYEIVMAEIVRYRKNQEGDIEISILDYDSGKKNWAIWNGLIYTNRTQIQKVSELTRIVIHSHLLTDEKIECKSELVKCSECDTFLDSRLLTMHLFKIHNIGIKDDESTLNV